MTSCRCNDCQNIFAERDAPGRIVLRDEPATDWDRTALHEVELACPKCASTDLSDVWMCVECKLQESDEGDDLCADCRDLEDELAFEEEALTYRKAS